MKLLRIDSSARRSSVSRLLTARFAEAWQHEHPQGQVLERDLAATALPHITDEWVQAIHSDPANLTAGQKQVLKVSGHSGRGTGRGRHHRDRRSHVQLRHSRAPQGLDRSGRARRQDSPLHPFGPARHLEGQEGLRHHLARRRIPSRDAHRTLRPSRAVLASHSGIHRIDRRNFIHAENQKPGAQGELARAAAIGQIEQLTHEVTASAAR